MQITEITKRYATAGELVPGVHTTLNYEVVDGKVPHKVDGAGSITPPVVDGVMGETIQANISLDTNTGSFSVYCYGVKSASQIPKEWIEAAIEEIQRDETRG